MDLEIIIFTIFILYVIILIYIIIKIIAKQSEIKRKEEEKIRIVIEGKGSLSVSDFFRIRNSYKGHLQDFDFMGCYILKNITKNKCYVGQSKHVTQRINTHFSGKGNGDVYVDYRIGDIFEIYMIDITKTTYRRLDYLERYLIQLYNSNITGYNKTKGNK